MAVNELKSIWRRGEPAFGAWCSSGSPVMAELLALEPFDYICLDLQHGLTGYEGFLSCLCGVAPRATTPIARAPAKDVAWTGKVIDPGAQGVIIPMINTPEEAALAVA